MPSLGAQRPFLLALVFTTLGGYFMYCWRNGQTLAMRAWKIRIVDASGAAPPLGRACIRYVVGWVWVVPPLAAMAALAPHAASFSAALGLDAAALGVWIALWSLASLLRDDRQFWHDVASGTRLVDA